MFTSAVLATAALPTDFAEHGMHGGGFGFGFLFVLIPLFFITLAVVLFATAGRRWLRAAWASGRFGQELPGRRAEATLAERFAQGDIDEVEYRARLEVLRANNPTPPYPGR